MRIEAALWVGADERGQRVAILDRDREIPYVELAQRAAGLATALAARGVSPGDRVAVFLDKTPECVVALYGVWAAGAAIVPIHEGLKRAQLEHILGDSGARCLITDPRNLRRAGAEELSIATLAVGDERSAPSPRCDTDDCELAAILYTSGSTGRPKGIALSHANLVAGARIVASYLGITPEDRILSVLPFSFDYGLNQLLTSVRVGAQLVLQRSHFAPDICRALLRHRITGLAGVPPLWAQLLERSSPLERMQLPALRYITNSGGVFPPALLARYRELLHGTDIVLMYGLTEAFRSTYLPPAELAARPGSMGRAIPECDVFALDPQGRRCAPGEVGELVHDGPTVALGYWRNPAATDAVFRPHPLDAHATRKVVYSGDLVRQDADGYFSFVGRRDQMLKCQGFRLSPDDVEAQLHATGLVHEVVIQGRPDPAAGTLLVAHLVPRDPARFCNEELLDACRRSMPAYMIPSEIVLYESLPRTPSGKLDRKGLARR